MKSYAERAAAGADVLDSMYPDWYCKVELDTLSMSSCTRCILGQLWGSYDQGLEHVYKYLRKIEGIPSAFGFDAAHANPVHWGLLNHAWGKEVQARREKHNA